MYKCILMESYTIKKCQGGLAPMHTLFLANINTINRNLKNAFLNNCDLGKCCGNFRNDVRVKMNAYTHSLSLLSLPLIFSLTLLFSL